MIFSGKQYLDLISGIGVSALTRHCHQKNCGSHTGGKQQNIRFDGLRGICPSTTSAVSKNINRRIAHQFIFG